MKDKKRLKQIIEQLERIEELLIEEQRYRSKQKSIEDYANVVDALACVSDSIDTLNQIK